MVLTALRSNYSFAMIPGEKRKFGKCDMEIEGRKAEPPPDKRGHIARTYFYMDWAYPGHGIISKKNRKLPYPFSTNYHPIKPSVLK